MSSSEESEHALVVHPRKRNKRNESRPPKRARTSDSGKDEEEEEPEPPVLTPTQKRLSNAKAVRIKKARTDDAEGSDEKYRALEREARALELRAQRAEAELAEAKSPTKIAGRAGSILTSFVAAGLAQKPLSFAEMIELTRRMQQPHD